MKADRVVHFVMGRGHRRLARAPGVMRVADFKVLASPMLRNHAASLWDIGDGVACLEFHTKANVLGPESMALMRQALDKVAERHAALVIHSDGPHFSVGFNLDFVRACIADRRWKALDDGLVEFQHTCRAAKHAPFPVVSAPGGLALGGGFEVLLGSDLVQAHANVVVGLVEPLVGLVPAGGGCKEMLLRWTEGARDEAARTAGALRVFELVGTSRTATSPELARPLRLLRAVDPATMNRDRLLADAKASALGLADGYRPPAPPTIFAPGAPARDAMCAMLDDMAMKGLALPHDVVVSTCLARGPRGRGTRKPGRSSARKRCSGSNERRSSRSQALRRPPRGSPTCSIGDARCGTERDLHVRTEPRPAPRTGSGPNPLRDPPGRRSWRAAAVKAGRAAPPPPCRTASRTPI